MLGIHAGPRVGEKEGFHVFVNRRNRGSRRRDGGQEGRERRGR